VKSAGSFILLLVLSILAPAIQAQQSTVRAELGASTISIEESVKLTIVAIGVDGELDTSALERDFEIAGRSSNIETQARSDGRKTNFIQTRRWVLDLVPKSAGNYILPPVGVGQEYSAPLTLRVTPPRQGAQRDIYVEASVDTSNPWVQSQVLLTVRVFQAIEIVDGSLGAPEGDALNVEQLGEDKRLEQTRDGRRYAVTERRFAVFPQRSGKLVINPIRLNVSVPTEPNRVRGFFTPTKSIRRQTESIVLDVKARPATGGSWWLPARAVTLEERWSADPDQATVDQPLTRTLILRAVGATTTQLPSIDLPTVQGLSIYAEEPVNNSGFSDDGLIAEQRINWAIIPDSTGEQVLPAISIDWFNTVTGQNETIELAATNLRVSLSNNSSNQANTGQLDELVSRNGSTQNDSSVAGLSGQASAGTGSITSDPNQSAIRGSDTSIAESDNDTSAGDIANDVSQIADQNDSRISDLSESLEKSRLLASGYLDSVKRWQFASAALLLGWLVTLGYFFYKRRSRMASLSGSPETLTNRLGAVRGKAHQLRLRLAPLTEVELSCREDDPGALSEAVLRWAALQFPDQPPRSLSLLAERFQDHAVSDDLRALDADLYRPGDSVSLEPERYRGLAGALSDAIKADSAAEAMELGGESGGPRAGSQAGSQAGPQANRRAGSGPQRAASTMKNRLPDL